MAEIKGFVNSKITYISNNGVLSVSFSHKMLIPTNINHTLNNTLILNMINQNSSQELNFTIISFKK